MDACRVWPVIWVIFGWMMAAPVWAQSEALTQEGQLKEGFLGAATVSGRFLAGLAEPSPNAPLDLDQVRLNYHGSDVNTNICIIFQTADGRYWAKGNYRGASSYSTQPRIPLKTAYRQALSQYMSSDFLVLASIGSCEHVGSDEAVLVPAHFGLPSRPSRLVAYINANYADVSARIDFVVGNPIFAQCRNVDQPGRVAYSNICEFVMSKNSQSSGRLTLGVTALTGETSTEVVNVALW